MQLVSTRNPGLRVSLKEAVMTGLPPDNGLYMPVEIPQLPASFFQEAHSWSFEKMSFEVARHLMAGALPEEVLESVVYGALGFDAPLVHPGTDQVSFLELFHGPTLAFKDFGARFMARLMGHYVQDEKRELVILTATSGDTGGAVAAGFHQTPGIRVVVLYPEGKVSPLQEKQIAALGGNIHALRVSGSFDDCQALVKQAFLDEELRTQRWLTSANSINIARLIPQSFYYFRAWQQTDPDSRLAFVVPSGNFGNLTAGLFAARMGLPVSGFVAATNANDVVPVYLRTGEFQPRPSTATLSNAMDVGNPSNFARMAYIFQNDVQAMGEELSGYAYSDSQTLEAITGLWQTYGYLADPHTAVGYLAAREWASAHPGLRAAVLATAHPAKFIETVATAIGGDIALPPELSRLVELPILARDISTDYTEFKEALIKITS